VPEKGVSRIVRSGEFEIDLGARELRRNGRRVSIQDQPFELLAALVEAPGREVPCDELIRRLWPDGTFVDYETGLNSAVKRLRDALGDSAQEPRFIETRARHGYRFIAPAEVVVVAPIGDAPGAAPRAPWLVYATLAAILLLAAAGIFWRRQQAVKPAERLVLVVLPFDNLSGDPEQEYFSDGMTDEMISRLGQRQAGRVTVLGGATSRHYKSSTMPAEEIARELNADYTLAGSVRRAADQVRITAELVRTRDRRLLWSESYDGEVSGLLDLQRKAAEAISRQLPQVGHEPAQTAPGRGVDPAAYEAYLKGRYFWNQVSEVGERKAIESFQEAIRLDPTYAPAYAWQGSAYQMLGNLGGLRPSEVVEHAWPLVNKAVELDPESADAQGCLGWTSLLYVWDFEGAERAFRRALEINPNHVNARHGLATYLTVMGRLDEALAEMERAHQNDPLSLVTDADVAYTLYLMGRNDQALARIRAILELDPKFPPAHYFASLVYQALGRDREAFDEGALATVLSMGKEPPWVTEDRRVFAAGGMLAWRRRWIEASKTDPMVQEFGAMSIAEFHLELGSRSEALDWLEKAYEKRPYQLAYLKVEPIWAPLRGEPRFQALLERIGLPP
jgi:TolB-like protein/DNA-binding winged helix-turn-helix (wHTH) protein